MDVKLFVVNSNLGLPPAFDAQIGTGDLLMDDGLETAIMVSLFTDRRATDDDVLPDASGDKRGWWGDSYAEIPRDLIGSRLWLLERERDLPDVPKRAKIYIEEALQWIRDDGIADQIDVVVERLRPGVFGYTVTVTQPKTAPRQFQFQHFWRSV